MLLVAGAGLGAEHPPGAYPFLASPWRGSDPLAGEELSRCLGGLFEATQQRREDEAHAWQSLKLLGSEAVKAQLWWPAEATYRMALEEGGRLPEAEASLIHSNRVPRRMRSASSLLFKDDFGSGQVISIIPLATLASNHHKTVVSSTSVMDF